MTDNEIIKALETALKTGDEPIGEHWGCFLTTATVKDALDLINRQNAEIDALIDGQETLQKNLPKVIKAEAIKEFAERLKSKVRKLTEYDEGGWDCTIYAVDVEDIDNLVKEMIGENNGN